MSIVAHCRKNGLVDIVVSNIIETVCEWTYSDSIDLFDFVFLVLGHAILVVEKTLLILKKCVLMILMLVKI